MASRNGALGLMAGELINSKIEKKKSALIRQSWIAKGLVNSKLSSTLDELSGIPLPRLNTPNQMLRNSSNLVKRVILMRGLKFLNQLNLAVWLVIKLVILEELLDQIFQPWGVGFPLRE